ncbi:MAG TPA: hypothetical protein VE130_01315 [Nitrososphaeraceae archaeon]|nr:hypothetical protein [Nitrososphaeraceae archaeon]
MNTLELIRKEEEKKYQKDLEYLKSHYHDLRAKYGDKSFIAIKKEKIFGYNTDPERLKEDLKREYVDLSQFLIQYLGE